MAKETVKAKEESNEDKLVALEMTEAEKAEFVAFKQEKYEKEQAKKASEDIVLITVKNSHQVNGTIYAKGGSYRVPRAIAEGLLVADQKATDSYMAQFVSNRTEIEMLMSGRAKITKVIGDA